MAISFIKIDVAIQEDPKIKVILKKKHGDTLFRLWIGMMCLAMTSSRPGVIEIGEGIPFTSDELSDQFSIKKTVVDEGIELFLRLKMIEHWEDGTLFIRNFSKHQQLDKIERRREQSRLSSQKYREKRQGDLSRDGHVTKGDGEGDTPDKDKDKDKDEHEDEDGLTPSPDRLFKVDLTEPPGEPASGLTTQETKAIAAAAAIWEPLRKVKKRLLNIDAPLMANMKEKDILQDIVKSEGFQLDKVILKYARYCRMNLDSNDKVEGRIIAENWPFWGFRAKYAALGEKAKQTRPKVETKVVEKDDGTYAIHQKPDAQEQKTQKLVKDLAASFRSPVQDMKTNKDGEQLFNNPK